MKQKWPCETLESRSLKGAAAAVAAALSLYVTPLCLENFFQSRSSSPSQAFQGPQPRPASWLQPCDRPRATAGLPTLGNRQFMLVVLSFEALSLQQYITDALCCLWGPISSDVTVLLSSPVPVCLLRPAILSVLVLCVVVAHVPVVGPWDGMSHRKI